MKRNDLSILLSLNNDIATIKDDKELFMTIFRKLHDHYGIQVAGVALFDEDRNRLGFIIGKISELESLDKLLFWFHSYDIESLSIELSTEDPQITYVKSDFFKFFNAIGNNNHSFYELIKDMEIKSFDFIPMKTGGKFIGYLFLPVEDSRLHQNDKTYLIRIANLLGSAIENTIAYEKLQYREKLKDMQLNLLGTLVYEKKTETVGIKLVEEINKLIPLDHLIIYGEAEDATKLSENSDTSFMWCFTKDHISKFHMVKITRSIEASFKKIIEYKNLNLTNGYYEYSGKEFESLSKQNAHLTELKNKYGIKSILPISYEYHGVGKLVLIFGRKNPAVIPLERFYFVLLFSRKVKEYFHSKEIDLAQLCIPQIGLILANVFAFEEISFLTKKLEQEKSYLLDEINLSNNFQEIIGESDPLIKTLHKVKQVAPLSATVLIQGETGTGKELIAKAIHNLSERKEKAFITVNCAVLPAQLIESELFGHEKGSFTGAIERRLGKFEVADGGTIFLDEIGELPLELQAKLLRVLQEKEFERVGGKTTIYSDVRIIAATNRDLEKEIEQGKFRADLFFRLNVFPIKVPALRERTEDIPPLVKHFIEKYSKRIGKRVKFIKKTDLEKLLHYNWPGNIRELEHLIERAVITSDGSNIKFDHFITGELDTNHKDIESFKPLVELEKEHIIAALKLTNGKVTGTDSAANLLGINGKTLGSKMRKFGIKREIVITS